MSRLDGKKRAKLPNSAFAYVERTPYPENDERPVSSTADIAGQSRKAGAGQEQPLVGDASIPAMGVRWLDLLSLTR